MPNIDNLKRITLDEQYLLFQSCIISNKYPGIESATKAVLSELGIGYVESAEQTCCGGSILSLTTVGQAAAPLMMVARNFAIAEEMGLNILTMCNGCYKNLAEFSHYINEHRDVKERVNEQLQFINKIYFGRSNVYHVFELLYLLKDRICEKVKKPLKGFRFATHYGCHYLFGTKKTAIDDPFQPVVIEEIIRLLGGEVVEYAEKRACCGSGITRNNYIDKSASAVANMRKLDSLTKANVDAVIVICPNCFMNLDRIQFQLANKMGKQYDTPVIYITQLIGLALGINPLQMGLDAQVTYPRKLLEKVEELYA